MVLDLLGLEGWAILSVFGAQADTVVDSSDMVSLAGQDSPETNVVRTMILGFRGRIGTVCAV